ncbi:MAG TPA: hypothetical protein VN626_01770 [Clostridia bacterium]|nr:hypothetical protein [Clostridia bacterium]
MAGKLLVTVAAEEDEVTLANEEAPEEAAVEEDAVEEDDVLSDTSEEDSGSLSDDSEEDSGSLIDSEVLDEGSSETSLFFKSDTPMLTATMNISSARATMTMEDIGDFFAMRFLAIVLLHLIKKIFYQPL